MSRRNFLHLERKVTNNKWQDGFTEKAKEFIKFGATDEVLALAFNVTVETIRKWKRDFPEFGEAVVSEKMKTDALVAFALFRSATGYTYEEKRTTIKNGVVTEEIFEKHQRGDPWAQLQWLKLRQKDLWAEDKGMMVGNTTININNLNQINLDSLNNEELKLALKLGLQQKSIGESE